MVHLDTYRYAPGRDVDPNVLAAAPTYPANHMQEDWLSWAFHVRADSWKHNVGFQLNLSPNVVPPHRLTAGLRKIVTDHSALRTLFSEPSPGRLLQHVLPVTAADPGAEFHRCSDACFTRCADRLRRHCFDITRELPWKLAFHCAGDLVKALVVVVDHAASDAWGAGVLMAALTTELGLEPDRATPLHRILVSRVRPPARPTDFLTWEHSNHGRAALARSQAHWEAVVREVAASKTATAPFLATHRPDTPEDNRAYKLTLWSPHLRRNRRECRRLHRIADAAAALAAVAAGYHVALGSQRYLAHSVFHNRALLGAYNSVCYTMMPGIVIVDTDPELTVAEYLRQVGSRFQDAGRHVNVRQQEINRRLSMILTDKTPGFGTITSRDFGYNFRGDAEGPDLNLDDTVGQPTIETVGQARVEVSRENIPSAPKFMVTYESDETDSDLISVATLPRVTRPDDAALVLRSALAMTRIFADPDFADTTLRDAAGYLRHTFGEDIVGAGSARRREG